MKSKNIMKLVLLAIMCVPLLSCKKDNIETPPESAKLYLPATLKVLNANTGATIFTAHYSYNADSSLSKIEEISNGNTLRWIFDYNPNGTLKTVAQTNESSSSYNVFFEFSYDVNNKVDQVAHSGYMPDTTLYAYQLGTKTYLGTGGEHDGLRLKLNSQGQLDNMQDWQGAYDINLTYDASKKGVFANVNYDESTVLFLSIYHFHSLSNSFFHAQQMTSAEWVDGTYTWQNYSLDDNGYITAFDTWRGSRISQNYIVTYNAL